MVADHDVTRQQLPAVSDRQEQASALYTNAVAHLSRTRTSGVVDNTHPQRSEVETQAEIFRNCFRPIAFRLDRHFGWMTDAQRAELGKKADEALKQAYIDQYTEMYESDES